MGLTSLKQYDQCHKTPHWPKTKVCDLFMRQSAHMAVPQCINHAFEPFLQAIYLF